MARFRRHVLGLPERPEDAGWYNLVVVGGGIAGTCAAVSAARLGLSVALIQDRPVLGGNNSSEVRVWLQGARNCARTATVGDVRASWSRPTAPITVPPTPPHCTRTRGRSPWSGRRRTSACASIIE